jgi:hypothetical protein
MSAMAHHRQLVSASVLVSVVISIAAEAVARAVSSLAIRWRTPGMAEHAPRRAISVALVSDAARAAGYWPPCLSTSAFESAIAAIATPGGGVIYIPAGTYTISSTLTCTTVPAYFLGDGAWATIISFTGTGDCFRVYDSSTPGPAASAGTSATRLRS